MRNHTSPTAFALLGDTPLEKSALMRAGLGMLGRGAKAIGGAVMRNPFKSMGAAAAGTAALNSQPGQGLWNTMAGKANAAGAGLMQGAATNWAGAKALFSGQGGDAVQKAMDNKHNAYQSQIDKQTQRADKGWNTATGYAGGAVERFNRPFATAGAMAQGFGSGGLGGAGRAADDAWNNSTQKINQLDQQATTGMLPGTAKSPAAPAAPATTPAPAGPPEVMGPPAPGSMAAAPNIPGSGPMQSAVPFTSENIAAPPRAIPVGQPRPPTPGQPTPQYAAQTGMF